MSNTLRRIRCLCCGELVAPLPTQTGPFAACVFTLGKRRGCICSDCVQDLYDIFEDMLDEKFEDKMPIPHSAQADEIGLTPLPEKKQLDIMKSRYPCLEYSIDSYVAAASEKVFGQDEAVQKLVYTIYHNQMANFMNDLGCDSPPREHILLIGSTGVGKTYASTTVLNMMEIPYAKSDASAITSAGYVGDNVEEILERLLSAAGNNVERAQNGVVIIDEIDKKRKSDDGLGRDINGLAVQQELLKVLEPSTVWIKRGTVPFDTSHLTVILCGAFVGLDTIIEKRLAPRQIGFSNTKSQIKDILAQCEPTDLVKYGFIEEFVGRLPNPTILKPLAPSNIMDIIYDNLLQQDTLFKSKGFSLIVDELVLNKLVNRVLAHNTGARDVKKEVSALLYPAKYRLMQSTPNGICEIDENGATTMIYNSANSPNPMLMHVKGPDYLQDEDDN